MTRLFAVLVFLAGALVAASGARAHEMSMAEMELREIAPGEFYWQWTASGTVPAQDVLAPVWPEGCQADGSSLHCGPGGLRGTLAVDGVGKKYSAALIKAGWLDGRTRVFTLTGAQPSVQVYGSAEDERGMGEVARAYLLLGIEHILTGYDHLLFVVGLLFLVGFGKRLLWTITAFTLAHSCTLALSALGVLTLRPPPVEATIALSIVLVAAEALQDRETLARRWPALVAFLFGLVHGLGFAGALKEIGLPQNHLAVALVAFNGGVEIGQLFVVAVAWLAAKAVAARPAVVLARAPALYAIGAIAAYWSIDRIVRIAA